MSESPTKIDHMVMLPFALPMNAMIYLEQYVTLFGNNTCMFFDPMSMPAYCLEKVPGVTQSCFESQTKFLLPTSHIFQ